MLVRRCIVVALLFVTFAAFVSIDANAQIAAGAIIPLDVSKATDTDAISKIVSSCMLEESLMSFLAIPTNATLTASNDAYAEGEEVGNQTTWTKTSTWYPQTDAEMTFEEWTTPTVPVKRFINLGLRADTSYSDPLNQVLRADVSTDAKGDDVDVSLYLDIGFPHYAVTSTGGQECTVNNWGRNGCRPTTEQFTAVNLVIPTTFVSTNYWINERTDKQTNKQFDTFKYAECLLRKWKAPR